MAAKAILRRAVRLPAQAYAVATGYLGDTLDWMNPYWPPDAEHIEIDGDFSPQQNQNFPQP
jgi:hypothetical protein